MRRVIRRMCSVAVEPIARGWLKGIVLSTVAAAAAYLATVLWVGRLDVSAAVSLVSVDTLLGLLALSMMNYGLRFLRWHYYLRTLGASIPLGHDLRVYIAGFALTATPGKAGEMARSLWLRPYGVSATFSLAAFLAERLQDFLAILLLSSLGVSLYGGVDWLLSMSLGLVALAAGILYVPLITRWALALAGGRRKRLGALVSRLSEILALTKTCLTPRRFALGLLIGLCAWSAEAFGFFLLMQALGNPLRLLSAISIYALSMLAGALSFMPGGLGGSEASMIVLLRILSVPLPMAVSATLLIRLATLWFAVLLGILALLIRAKIPTMTTASTAATQPDSV
jgi:uncharacterized protein (TIRG00374 family)